MKILLTMLALSLGLSQNTTQDHDMENIKKLVIEFIEATDVQDTGRLSKTMHEQAMQYVRFGDSQFIFSKAQYLEQLEAKKVGGKPRSIHFGEVLGKGSGVVTLSLTATSSELKFDYQVSMLRGTEGWLITSINTEVSRP